MDKAQQIVSRLLEAANVRNFIKQNPIPSAFCGNCGFDLTQECSVTRDYYSKTSGEDPDTDVRVEGHYQDGNFEPDDDPGYPLDGYDLCADSDWCNSCGSRDIKFR